MKMIKDEINIIKVKITTLRLKEGFLEFICTPIDSTDDTILRRACGKLIKNTTGVNATLMIDIENME